MGRIIQVGMADLKMARAPDKLMTTGLGSCIGICIYEKTIKIGSLAHIMLPNSVSAKYQENKAKFADTAIELLLDILTRNGANLDHLQAKVAGGAQMFKFSGDSDIMKIGERNAIAVEENLKKYHIPIIAKDIGGNYGRTITFEPETGNLIIRTIGHGERVI
ncbi:MAG: chemotaxis protein CheD [Syntrophomonadaceae bacterium]|jgi:chemotaxis protein CheD